MTLKDPVDTWRNAVLDSAHRVRVGHEVYFFASTKARDRFRADPLRWCGPLTDPVSQVRFRPSKRSPQAEYNGRRYFFYSAENRDAFRKNPAMYAEAKRAMMMPKAE